MPDIAIIGGTGLTSLHSLHILYEEIIETPFGAPSSPIRVGKFADQEILFLARHGDQHNIPPHKVNYRANLWALQQLGVTNIIAMAAVGGITDAFAPKVIAIPDQIIDYSYGRQHTFYEDGLDEVTHIDFSFPYCEELRTKLIKAADLAQLSVITKATYGATQGPRLESAAEIRRMERDGCDIVGMTGMPEAALAKELDICYASCALVANWAAGKGGDGIITIDEIHQNVQDGLGRVYGLLTKLLQS